MISKSYVSKTYFLVVIVVCLTLGLVAFTNESKAQSLKSTLSLDEYLEQVKLQNLTITASEKFMESYDLLKEKAKLVNAIKFYGYSEESYAKQNQALQIFRYNTIYNQNNRIGITQNSDFGLKTNFYYSLNSVKYKGLNTTNFSNPSLARKNNQAIPVIELSVPFIQNRLGANNRANKDATYYENEAQKLSSKAISLSEIVEAERLYWTVVFAKKTLEIQNRALSSAQKILAYVSKKEKMNLGERSDVLQARAMVENRKLLVQQAENFLRISARDFNQRRNIVSEKIEEKLEDFNLSKLQNFVIQNSRSDDRLDIKAQKAQMESAKSYAKIEEENNKPALNLYGSYSMNQVSNNYAQAAGSSFSNNAPSSKIGVEFSMPLNLSLSSDIREGAIKKASAEKINYRQKLLQQENDWESLLENLRNIQQNLRLAIQIQEAQKLKLENERNLLLQGRTSTYQILVFEQEFSNSELNTQQIAQKLHELIAQQKLYATKL